MFAKLTLALLLAVMNLSAAQRQVAPVSKDALDLGEGPFWDARKQCLWLVDAFVGDVCKLDVATGQIEKHNLGKFLLVHLYKCIGERDYCMNFYLFKIKIN